MQKAEHNDGCLSTLQELTLHQQNIERVDLLGHACRGLKILYLQNNLISRLENLHHLKVTCMICQSCLHGVSLSSLHASATPLLPELQSREWV